MFNLGFTEIIVVIVLALVILGPKRLPVAAGALGKAIREFKRAVNEFRHYFNESLTLPETSEKLTSHKSPTTHETAVERSH